eukprot:1980276-Prymnesium_polylepis.1
MSECRNRCRNVGTVVGMSEPLSDVIGLSTTFVSAWVRLRDVLCRTSHPSVHRPVRPSVRPVRARIEGECAA